MRRKASCSADHAARARSGDNGRMLWWFERAGQRALIEVVHPLSGDLELHVIGSDGVERVEYFKTADQLEARRQKIQDELIADGWASRAGWIL
jgi:hypothetical protein